MGKISKVLIIIISTIIALSGIAYAATQIFKMVNEKNNATFNSNFQNTLDENTSKNIWIGTLDLAWKELAKKVSRGEEIQLNENVEIANKLNQSVFSKEMISKEDYSINIKKTSTGGYDIQATLNKDLNFLHEFDNFNEYNYKFGKNSEGDEYIKYFGINNASPEKLNENVEVLFYNETSTYSTNNDFAVKLKTKEGDEIILYRTDEQKTLDEYYKDIKNKAREYTGEKTFAKEDELLVPYINISGMISYNELVGKTIKNTNMYIEDVVQNVKFSLNESGCNLESKTTMVTQIFASTERYFKFEDTFIIFMKEKEYDNPYFALKVDNTDILEKKEETDDPKLIDYTMTADDYYEKYLDGIEYKFYEDENYEYYYPHQKTKVVQVFFKDGSWMTVEQALKENKITLNLLDKYEVEYIKKNK